MNISLLVQPQPQRDTSEHIKFDHAYQCPQCGGIYLGLMCRKDDEGKRRCPDCRLFYVTDITFTDLGADYLRRIGPIDKPF